MTLTVALALFAFVSPSEVSPERLERLTHGISLIPAWSKDAPLRLDRLDESIKPDDLKQLATMGFRHVRIPLEFADRARAQRNLRAATDAGLAIVLCADPTKDPNWSSVATLLSAFDPNWVYIEVAAGSLSPARAALPGTTLVLDLPASLDRTKPVPDGNVAYRVSFWEPIAFTKQKARLDLPYPSTPQSIADRMPDLPDGEKAGAKDYGDARWNADKLGRLARKCADWAAKYNAAVVCEFGCSATAPAGSRGQWLLDARTALDANGLSWEVADYDGPAHLFNGSPGNRSADHSLLEALNLSK